MTTQPDALVVTYAELNRAAGTIDRQGRQLETDLEALQSRIRDVSQHFEGEAKNAADSMHRDWDRQAKEIHLALKSIAQAVLDAAPAYQAGDRKAASYYL
ncbi:WXG domain conatining protein [Streptomyces sp. YIM 130001]|uniref:WXG100 family type VII secretion target n=1 Tax=Streptomyces sp. YIM 130001 TaxID=2259644 RepID=UPI000E659AD9|nr:WXG100 family type VII secretion target [Streptomyces sp. YIM 130001]RII08012.1 WXG domain conatining protein [Streptomyces sp. YIM 130001]